MSAFKTRIEMALEYGIHRNTFIDKVKRAGIILPSGDISPYYQKLIYERLGPPPSMTQQFAASDSTFEQIQARKNK